MKFIIRLSILTVFLSIGALFGAGNELDLDQLADHADSSKDHCIDQLIIICYKKSLTPIEMAPLLAQRALENIRACKDKILVKRTPVFSLLVAFERECEGTVKTCTQLPKPGGIDPQLSLIQLIVEEHKDTCEWIFDRIAALIDLYQELNIEEDFITQTARLNSHLQRALELIGFTALALELTTKNLT